MEDGNIKHDFEQVARSVSHSAEKSSRQINKILKRILVSSTFFVNKRFNASMKSLQKDGPTKEMVSTPPLTHSEMKDIVAKAKESGILVGIKEMSPEGEIGRRKSLHSQEKIAKHNIKIQKYKNLSSLFKKIKPLYNLFDRLAQREEKRMDLDNIKHAEKRYVILCNKSKVSFLNDQLENIQKSRTEKLKQNDLEDINKDGIIDEKDIGELKSRSIKMDPKEMDQINEDYGDTLLSEFHIDYFTQKLSKEEYCAIREEMFDLYCHAARTTADGKVLIAAPSKYLDEYMKYAPTSPIKEFGRKGGIDILSVEDDKHLQQLKVNNEQEWQKVKEKYAGADFIASHNADGTISFIIREEDTQILLALAQKKTTDSLLEEANDMINEAKIDNPDITLEQSTESLESIENGIEDISEGMELDAG